MAEFNICVLVSILWLYFLDTLASDEIILLFSIDGIALDYMNYQLI